MVEESWQPEALLLKFAEFDLSNELFDVIYALCQVVQVCREVNVTRVTVLDPLTGRAIRLNAVERVL